MSTQAHVRILTTLLILATLLTPAFLPWPPSWPVAVLTAGAMAVMGWLIHGFVRRRPWARAAWLWLSALNLVGIAVTFWAVRLAAVDPLYPGVIALYAFDAALSVYLLVFLNTRAAKIAFYPRPPFHPQWSRRAAAQGCAMVLVIVLAVLAAVVFGFFRSLARKTAEAEIRILDLDTGGVETLTDSNRNFQPRFSPDGKRVAHCHRYPRGEAPGRSDLRVWDLGRGEGWALLADGAFHSDPAWLPDGNGLVFVSDRGGRKDIWRIGLEDRRPVPVTRDDAVERRPRVSPDGTRILFLQVHDASGYNALFLVPVAGGAKRLLAAPENFLTVPQDAAWRGDAGAVAYVSSLRLHLVDLAGGEQGTRELAPLQNVTNLMFDPTDANRLWFTARGDPLRFTVNLFTLDLEDGGWEAVAPAAIGRRYHMAPDAERVVFAD